MPGPGQYDQMGGLPPYGIGAPDPSTLQWPWSIPPEPIPEGPPPQVSAGAQQPVDLQQPLQPGLGIPAAAVDAAAGPAPMLGPQQDGAQSPPSIPMPAPEPAPADIPYGAGAPTPGAAPLGPPPPTVAQLPDLTVRTDSEPTYSEQLAADPLRTKDNGPFESTPAQSDEAAGLAIANLPPEQRAAVQAKYEAAKTNEYATKLLEASTQNRIKAQQNAAAYEKGNAYAQQKAAELEADVKALANTKIDPTGGISSGQRVMGIIASAIGGGLQSRTGGRNAGLDALNDTINRGIETQKADIQNRRASLTARGSAVAEMFQRTGDLYRAGETARIATWEATVQQLQAEQLKYDPHGTTALKIGSLITGARAQQAAAVNGYQQQQFKNGVEAAKLGQEAAKNAEEARHHQVDETIEAYKAKPGVGGGLGGGSGTNPSYNVATGFFNPFDQTQPIFGKRTIGGKGEDPKERNQVAAQIATYGHIQDYWDKLGSIGRQIGNAKSAGESIWAARKSTLGAEYDAAREALTVYLTKELGDKLTQGQLEAQAHRIPLRASLFEARDPAKQISAAQEDADRDFERDMNLVGVDAVPVIKAAQQRRAVTQPTPEQDLDAANAAVADNPGSKDAKAAKEAAESRVKQEATAQQKRVGDIATANTLSGPAAPLSAPSVGDTGDTLATDEAAAVTAANRAAAKYGDLLKQFKAQTASRDYLSGAKLPGDVAVVTRTHEQKLGELAGDVLKARDQYEQDYRKAHEAGATRALAERVHRAGELVHAGANPLTYDQAQPPPNPLFPDRSYRGVDQFRDPFADPLDSPFADKSYKPKPAPPKKGKH